MVSVGIERVTKCSCSLVVLTWITYAVSWPPIKPHVPEVNKRPAQPPHRIFNKLVMVSCRPISGGNGKMATGFDHTIVKITFATRPYYVLYVCLCLSDDVCVEQMLRDVTMMSQNQLVHDFTVWNIPPPNKVVLHVKMQKNHNIFSQLSATLIVQLKMC